MTILSRKTKLKLQSWGKIELTRMKKRATSKTMIIFWLAFFICIIYVNYGPKAYAHYFSYVFICLTIVSMAISVRTTEYANITISNQKEKLAKQNELILKQKKLVEEKNREVLESITYAKRLQDAILPPIGLIQKYLPESFVLYKPKDIVAGDFYWMEALTNEVVLIAAADCTGHGVPGAIVSVVCSNALNRVVKELGITEPGKILDKTRELVLETFEKSESNIQDGMDISLCSLDIKNKRLQWSGAYNPLWVIAATKGATVELPADKQPIGKTDKPMPFTTHTMDLQKGDTLYLFTDGFADQFGGPKGKKLKYKPFQEILLAASHLPMNQQATHLETIFSNWKGNLDQVDDVLVIGIRI